jgi:hypothetical protein
MSEQKIIINAILPNPVGTDSQGEWIELLASEEVDVSQISLEINTTGIKPVVATGVIDGRFYLALNLEQENLTDLVRFKQPLTLLNSSSQLKLYLDGELQQTFSYENTKDDTVTVYNQSQNSYSTLLVTDYWNTFATPNPETPLPPPVKSTQKVANNTASIAKQEFTQLLRLHNTPGFSINEKASEQAANPFQAQPIDPLIFRTPTFVSTTEMIIPLSLLLVAVPLALVARLLVYEVSLALRSHRVAQWLWQKIVYIYRLRFSAGR